MKIAHDCGNRRAAFAAPLSDWNSASGSKACVKLSGYLQEVPVLPDWKHALELLTQEPEIFHDDGIRLDFHDPLGGKIAKDIFDIPRVIHAARDGKPEAGEHPVVLLHLVEGGMDIRQEELFASVGAQSDDAGNDGIKVGRNERHVRTSWIHPAWPDAKLVRRFLIL